MQKVSVVVIDDHRLIRDMWTKLFSLNDEIDLLGDCGTFDEAIEMIKTVRPNIALLDINLPPTSGLDAVLPIRKHSPGTKIIAVSMHTEPVYAKKIIQLGAKGYITKNSSFPEIYEAITEVMNGNIFICEEMKKILSDRFINEDETKPDTNQLSLREIEIVRQIKEGFSSKEISQNLFISIRTVDVHRQNILKKLKLKNTVALINFLNLNDL